MAKASGSKKQTKVPVMKRLTTEIPVSLHTKLKVAAAKRGIRMGELIKISLEKELK